MGENYERGKINYYIKHDAINDKSIVFDINVLHVGETAS